MAHYAIINEDSIVVNVIVGREEDDLPEGITSWEDHYAEINGMTCKRTSINTRGNQHLQGGTPFRGNHAEIGGEYDADADVFLPVKPFPSWVLDTETYLWEPPIPLPSESDPEWSPEVMAEYGFEDIDRSWSMNFVGFWDEANQRWAPPGVTIE